MKFTVAVWVMCLAWVIWYQGTVIKAQRRLIRSMAQVPACMDTPQPLKPNPYIPREQ